MDIEQLRLYTKWHYFANKKDYDAPADPWKLLQIDPTTVRYDNHEIRLNWGLGRVKGGNWDDKENCNLLSEGPIYRGLNQRFEENYDCEETILYQKLKETFEDGGTVRGYTSLEEYRNIRCEHIDKLFHSIEETGYRPNKEATHEKPAIDNPFEDAYVHYLEPLVVIGRSGDIYLTEGYHRFILAPIAGINEIPVYVSCRHEQWQRVRDQVHDTPASNLPSKLNVYSDHPDLRNFVL